MSDYARMDDRPNTHVLAEFGLGHQLCFAVHDTMLEALLSGLRSNVFTIEFKFRDQAERDALAQSSDIIEWLRQFRNEADVADVLVSVAFPTVLGDMLTFIYEALEASRKGKLTISYTLLRKPIQESLFLMEAILLDKLDFNSKLTSDPQKLRSQKAGGLQPHAERIARVIDALAEGDRFDAAYLAQLRYDKDADDGFDGPCNLATHLITDHKSIRTAPMNLNFIFTNFEALRTQWAYLYSRLPYIMFYIWRVVEKVIEGMDRTYEVYTAHINRVISASVLLWWETVAPRYRASMLERFVKGTHERLRIHCKDAVHL